MTVPESEIPTMSEGRISSQNRGQRLSILEGGRLFLAVALTGILPACWLFVFARGMGIPMKLSLWYPAAGCLVTIAAIPALCWKLTTTARRRWITGGLGFTVFGGVFTGILVTHVAESLPWWLLWVVLLSAAFWMYWLAWFVPLSRNLIAGVLLLAVAGGWGWIVPSILKFDGLTGDARAKFRWGVGVGETKFAEESKPDVPAQEVKVATLGPLDFPEFLGNRQGNLASRPMRTDWGTSPPQEVWRKPVGLGWSSFSLIGDLGVTMEQRGEKECTVCYRLSTGEELWRHEEETRFHGTLGGDGPRTTPTIDEVRVYSVGATGRLCCLDLATGEKKWGLDMLADSGGKTIYHGVCGSPLIADRKLIVSPTGGEGFSLVAYDKLTGHRLWRSGKWPATYSSPMLAKLKGEEQILIYNNKGIEGHSLPKGTLLWSYEWTNVESTICSQPVLVPGTDNQVLLSIGYSKGAVLLEVEGGADEEWSAKPVWTSKEMKTKFTTAVIHDGSIYGLDDGILACVDLKTGKRKWKKGRYQHGQLLLVGEWLVIQAEEGDVVLVKPNPEKLEEVGRITALKGKTWNNPAINKEYLVVRNDQEAICFRISPEDEVKVTQREGVSPGTAATP